MHDSQAASLGWFSLGLGIAQVAAPRTMARLIGASTSPLACASMRALGFREIVGGLGILSRSRPRVLVWVRVVGDVVELASFWGQLAGKQRRVGRFRLATMALVSVAALDAKAAIGTIRLGRARRNMPMDNAANSERASRGLATFAPPKPLRPRTPLVAVSTQQAIERAALSTAVAGADDDTPSQWTNQGFGTTGDDEVG